MRNGQEPTVAQKLKDLAEKRARRSGFDWAILADQCAELVVFGSQATGLQTRFSDLDILIVGKAGVATTVPNLQGMDLVFRTEQEILADDWLNSELAGHIAVYGQWLQGVSRWRTEALEALGQSENAAQAKRRRVDRLAQGLRCHGDRLTPDFRRRNLTTLRRERLRLEVLQLGLAVPPTRLLDLWVERGFPPNGSGLPALTHPEFLKKLAADQTGQPGDPDNPVIQFSRA